MKKQGSEWLRIILLLKRTFGKNYKVFDKFTDAADGFIKLSFCNSFYVYVCVCIFLCVYVCVYVNFMG